MLTITMASAQTSGFEMFVSGSKTVTAQINFDSITLKHTATGKEFLASNYQWIVSTRGTIYKGNYPADKLKLHAVMKTLKPEDLIFIEMIKANEGKLILVKGQVAFRIQ
jgi:hypothetical protein